MNGKERSEVLRQLFGDTYLSATDASDLTTERIADAAELSAAIAAVAFFRELGTEGGDRAADRLKKLVASLATRMCRRHGA
jgi:hypothetical protein